MFHDVTAGRLVGTVLYNSLPTYRNVTAPFDNSCGPLFIYDNMVHESSELSMGIMLDCICFININDNISNTCNFPRYLFYLQAWLFRSVCYHLLSNIHSLLPMRDEVWYSLYKSTMWPNLCDVFQE